jgi:hypothetical protein
VPHLLYQVMPTSGRRLATLRETLRILRAALTWVKDGEFVSTYEGGLRG